MPSNRSFEHRVGLHRESLIDYKENAMKLLHIDSSVLSENSVSRQLTRDLVEQWRHTVPGLEVYGTLHTPRASVRRGPRRNARPVSVSAQRSGRAG